MALAVSSAPDGRKVAIGTAARYDIAEAALAAVTEMIQTESSLDAALDADDPEALRWLENGSMLSQPQFLPAVDAVRDVSQPSDDMALLDRLDRIGLRALAKELTLQGDPIPTVRVVVPGLSDMGSRLDRDRLDRLCSGSLPRRVPAAPDPEPF